MPYALSFKIHILQSLKKEESKIFQILISVCLYVSRENKIFGSECYQNNPENNFILILR
jgi:hypothetical protein